MPDDIYMRVTAALKDGAEEIVISEEELETLRSETNIDRKMLFDEQSGRDPSYMGLKLIVQGDGITAAR